MTRLSPARLDELLQRASGLRVVVVGDVMLDLYLTGSVARISPEAPVPVVQVDGERAAPGGAANVAGNVAALGARCDLVGGVGHDPEGARIEAALAASFGPGITAHLARTPGRPTTTKTRVMARHQQVVRFDRESAADYGAAETQAVLARLEERLDGADALVLEDYNKGVLTTLLVRRALALAREGGIPSVVDPKHRGFFDFHGATVFKPNTLELAGAFGVAVRPSDDEWLEAARRRLGCDHLLLTLGEEGMVLRSDCGSSLRIPTVARDVFDVSGAGDTVTACVAVALAAGASIQEAALLANFAAGIEVGKPGVDVVTPDELRAAVQRTHLEQS
ncbi:MAG: PfkB family carbohydrate kinase [Gemmatimonadota bacterium]|jgi:D-beta-D-heptose 7-phosphate kinase/D-beta-D-heptose 1-phosphate adenosyltransferase|nr:PfkB family carbohydrate kinase [Gemmatimonadota bacterium]